MDVEECRLSEKVVVKENEVVVLIKFVVLGLVFLVEDLS